MFIGQIKKNDKQKNLKILIAEDDEDLRILYENFLRALGHKIVASASNGLDAINFYKDLPEKPDVVLLDYLMPVKNGLEAAQEILKINCSVKIIMISGYSEIKHKALEIGISYFLEKAILFKELIKMLKNF